MRKILAAFLTDPLQGRTSFARIFWLYGVVGSVLYGAIEFFLNPENTLVMRLYIIGGLIFSIYLTIATYRCAINIRSPFLARFVRVSAVISLLLLPALTYLELTGRLSLSALGGEQLPE